MGKSTIENHCSRKASGKYPCATRPLCLRSCGYRHRKLNQLHLLKTKSLKVWLKMLFTLRVVSATKNHRSEITDYPALGSVLSASYSLLHLMNEPMRQVMLSHFIDEATKVQNFYVTCPVL